MLAALHVLAALGEPARHPVVAGRPVRPLRRLRRDQLHRRRPAGPYRRGPGRPTPAVTGITTDDLDGLTVMSDDWWFNLRPSNTEPLLRLNVEARDEPTMVKVRDEVLHSGPCRAILMRTASPTRKGIGCAPAVPAPRTDPGPAVR